jgi:photosystem II stability/assembly factor-like uncharacterized protein
MQRILLFLFFYSTIAQAQEKKVDVSYFNTLPNISIRALEVLNDSVVWFGASNGVWGYTENAGMSWTIDSIKYEGKAPQFRSIALLDKNTALLLSIESPALLYKTTDKGKNWKLVYTNNHKDIFFDCMKFSDNKNGYAIADPIEGCMQLIKTNDAGDTWQVLDCTTLPKMKPNEAYFASSNSNIEAISNKLWIATGGLSSRILYSKNNAIKFTIQQPAILQGEKMGGIFSMDFYDKKTGAVVGGNYDKTDSNINSIFYTKDGGKNWTAIKTPIPYFGSCVQFKSKNIFYVTSHVGTMKVDLTKGKANVISDSKDSPLKFHTLRISPSGKVMWMAGSGGRMVKVNL